MTARTLIALAAGGSAALLVAAFAFQYVGRLAPCPICLWQRWPHAAAVVVGAVALARPALWLLALGAVAAGASAGIGLYHTGIERAWWPGPSTCAGGGQDLSGMSGADLLSTESAGAIVMCDEVAWSLAGLSMASWNALLSAALVAVWAAAWRASGS